MLVSNQHQSKYARIAERGVALLITVLVASMLLAVSGTITTIVLKEAVLSEVTAESLRAIYAADAGVDCAIYWDIPQNVFDPYLANSISCFGVTHSFLANASGPWTVASSVTWEFDFDVSGYCLDPGPAQFGLLITKSGVPTTTRIESRGISSCNPSEPRRVERAMRVRY